MTFKIGVSSVKYTDAVPYSVLLSLELAVQAPLTTSIYDLAKTYYLIVQHILEKYDIFIVWFHCTLS